MTIPLNIVCPFYPIIMSGPNAQEIAAFCRDCQLLRPDGSCSLDSGPRTKLTELIQIDELQREIGGRMSEAMRAVLAHFEHAATHTKQERYTERQWCGKATVGGEHGQMTEHGFTPWKK